MADDDGLVAQLPALTEHELEILSRALEVYDISLNQLKELVVGSGWDGDLRDNPIWASSHDQQVTCASLHTAVAETLILIERLKVHRADG